jgi:hypothetical protein
MFQFAIFGIWFLIWLGWACTRLGYISEATDEEKKKGYTYILKKYAPQNWHTFSKWFVPIWVIIGLLLHFFWFRK